MAHHGVGVSVRKGTGDWYCSLHWRMTPEGQAEQARHLRELSGDTND